MIRRCFGLTILTILMAVVLCLGGCGVAKPSSDAVPGKVAVADKTDYGPLIRQATWDAYEKVLQEVNASQFPVDPIMAQSRLKGKEASFLILDLRAPDVYAQKHVQGAVNLSIVALAENIASLPKDKTLLLYCYTGQSSALAMVPLKAYGYQAIFVNGGFAQMEKAGFIMDNKPVPFVPAKNEKTIDSRQTNILAGIQANLLAIARQDAPADFTAQARQRIDEGHRLLLKLVAEGTPIYGVNTGLGAAVDYLSQLGMAHIEAREQALLAYLTEALHGIDGLHIFGRAPRKAAVVSFAIDGTHSHDLATLLDLEGVAIRSGQHCAHPLLQWLGVGTTCRASLAFYNTHEEIDAFIVALHKVRKLLG